MQHPDIETATRALLGQEPGHTPGPYAVDQRGEHFFAVLGRNPQPSIFYQGLRLTVCTTDSREEAERIALCLGAHDEMETALMRAAAIIGDHVSGVERSAWPEVLHAIKAALALNTLYFSPEKQRDALQAAPPSIANAEDRS